MKKIILSGFIMLIACASYNTIRWVNQETLQVAGYGKLSSTDKNLNGLQERTLACKAGLLDAKAKIVIFFASMGVRGINSTVSSSEIQGKIRIKFSGTISRGNIVRKTFNSSTGECEVIYELREKNLKNKVNSFIKSIR